MPTWSTFYSRVFALAVAALLGYALFQIFAPFFNALSWAMFLAFLLYPANVRLRRRLRGPARAAGLLTVLTPLVILLPLAAVSIEFVAQVASLVRMLQKRAQQLDIKKIVKAAVPASVSDNVQHGGRQAMAVFTLPNGTETFATPIGYMDGNDEAYYTDLLFYYDDPHRIYSNWPKDVWAAIDAHQVKPGMSELETRMSIGGKIHPDGQTEGDRTVTYDQDGKQWTVTYVQNRATTIKAG